MNIIDIQDDFESTHTDGKVAGEGIRHPALGRIVLTFKQLSPDASEARTRNKKGHCSALISFSRELTRACLYDKISESVGKLINLDSIL